MLKKLLCRLVGHHHTWDSKNVLGPKICKRCGNLKPALSGDRMHWVSKAELFIAVTASNMMVSRNGIDWVRRPLPEKLSIAYLREVAKELT